MESDPWPWLQSEGTSHRLDCITVVGNSVILFTWSVSIAYTLCMTQHWKTDGVIFVHFKVSLKCFLNKNMIQPKVQLWTCLETLLLGDFLFAATTTLKRPFHPINLKHWNKERDIFKVGCSQSVVTKPATVPSPGNLVEMQLLGPDPRPSESETLRETPNSLYDATNPPVDVQGWEPLL